MRRSPRRSHALLAVCALALGASLAQAQGVSGVTGTIIITNKRPSTATIIDVASGRVLGTVPTGNGPHEIALTADARTAVITDYGGPGARNTLTVIDVPSARVTRTISLGEYRAPHGIVYLPGDSLVAVTSEATGNVVIVHVGEGVVRRAVPTSQPGSHMVGVTGNGAFGYTGNMAGNSVSQLDLTRGTFVKSWPVPTTPEAINVTPDGKEVWVGSNATGKVSVLDPATGAVTTAAEGVSWPYRVLFSPDVRTVLIPDMNNNELRFLERATRKELGRIALPEGGPQGIAISPDGHHVFLSLSKQSRVAVINARERRIVGYIAAGETPDGVVYTTRVLAR